MAMAMAMAEVKVSMGVRMGGGNPFFPMVRVCIIGVPLFIKTRLVTQEKCHTLGNILTY